MSKLGISFFTCPAAKSIAGIAITFFIELFLNLSKASVRDGFANSKKPNSTNKDGYSSCISLVNSWNSVIANLFLLPWPQMSMPICLFKFESKVSNCKE